VRAIPDSALRTYVLGHLAFSQGHYAEAERLLTRAWETCDPGVEWNVSGPAAVVMANLSFIGWRGGDTALWATRALEVAHGIEGIVGPAQGLAVMGLGIGGRLDEALAATSTLPDQVSHVDVSQATTLMGRGMVRMWTDDMAGAITDLQTVVRAWGGVEPQRIGALGQLAEAEFRAGDWDGALTHAHLAVSLATDSDQTWHLPFARSQLALVLACEGRFEQAEGFLDDALAGLEAGELDTGDCGAHARNAAAHLAFARGSLDGVIAAVQPLFELSRAEGMLEPGVFLWPCLWMDALVSSGRLDEAERELESYEARSRVQGRRSALANSARVRGKLEAARGRTKEARESFDAGLEGAREASGPFEIGLLEAAYGGMMRRHGQRHDAQVRLSSALDGFVQLGAEPFAARCEYELSVCGLHPPPRQRRDRTTLTPAEHATANLARKGLTNSEIAAELVVSVKTVEFHLGNAFGKLGIKSRRQLRSITSESEPDPAKD
jgi:ATP/maltotriose-dependent transcriptional regulator MalT